MRATFTLIHRWAGLFTAVFLFIAGATGAVISWDHELDEWLNPHLFDAKSTGAPLSPHELVRRVEAADPRIRVSFFPLSFEEGHNADLFVEPRVDPKTGELYQVDYNQVFIDPASGEIAAKRYWGAISLNSEDILPFLYKLHYSMHIPDFWGIDRWGMWFMGIVGIVWLFDCFVGFYLTLPRSGQVAGAIADTGMTSNPDDNGNPYGYGARAYRAADQAGSKHTARERLRGDIAVASAGQGTTSNPFAYGSRVYRAAEQAILKRLWWSRWAVAWKIKRGASTYRLNLDLHRAFGLWLWIALFILAFTSISMNLNNEVVRPILSMVSTLTPDAFDDRSPAPLNKPIEPALSFVEAIDVASAEARRRGWEEPAGSAFYGVLHGLYSISFFQPGDDHGSGGMGVKMIFLDGGTGSLQGGRVPWEGTAADIFMQLQFPLHSGRIAGIPGRVFLSFMGLVVALLSATGVYIWFKKRAGRIGRRAAAEVSESLFMRVTQWAQPRVISLVRRHWPRPGLW